LAAWPELAVPAKGGALMAAFGAEGVTVATWQDGSLDPWVLPTTVLPELGPSTLLGVPAQPTFIGVALRPPMSTSVALFLQDDTSPQRLVAYPLSTSLTTPVLPLTSVAVPDACIAGGQSVVRTGEAAVNPPATFVAFDGTDTCVAQFDASGNLTLQQLPTPTTLTLETRPALADIDGDGRFDVVDSVRLPSTDGTSAGTNAELVWLQSSTGSFGTPVVVPVTHLDGSDDAPISDGAIGVAPYLTGSNEREELVVAGTVLYNQTTGSGATFDPTQGFVAYPAPPAATSGPNSAAGDLNGDGLTDFVVWGSGFSVCFAVADGLSYSCAALSISLSPSDSVLVGDINGDAIADVIAVQHAVPGLVQVLLGHYRGALSPAAVTPRAPNEIGLGGGAIWPAGSTLAGQVAVYVPTQGMANGLADANGVLSFNYPVAAIDVAFADDNPDLWIATETADGGRVLRLPNGLITGAVEAPLGLVATGARFARLQPTHAFPLLVDAVATPPWVAGTTDTDPGGPIDSAPSTVNLLPGSVALTTHQLVVDLDGDGIAEILIEQTDATTGNCGVRVLHWTSASAANQFSDPPQIVNTALPCSELVVMDTPPFDGLLDLVLTSPSRAVYRMRSDFRFLPSNGAPLQIDDGTGNYDVYPTSLTEIASLDMNGDGIADLVALDYDSLPHVIFAQVKRR
jgi:hypothetical protein